MSEIMGGQLYLNNGQPPSRSNVCVSGYQRGKENFALSNFHDNNGKGYDFMDPHLGKVHFPTSEHYLHFQKIRPEHKAAHYAQWQTASAGDILGGIRNPSSKYFIRDDQHAYMTHNPHTGKYDFNQKWDEDKIAVQMQINTAKYQQSAEFQASIHNSIELGKALGDGKGPASIIEDTSSLANGKKPEEEWGTGPAGTGKNILGNTQTAFAKMVQDGLVSSTPPTLATYQSVQTKALYKEAEANYQGGIQKALIDVRQRSGKNNGLNQPDTSDLGGSLVQSVGIVNDKIVAPPFQGPQQSPPQHKAPQSVPTANQQASSQYYESKGGNQRLVINNNKVVGYEFRQTATTPWQTSGNPSYFKGLEDAFNKSHKTPHTTPQYYESKGGNQRLVINNNKVVGYEFRQTASAPWQTSGNPSYFKGLEDAFNKSHKTPHTTPHTAPQYYESNGGNQRLVINNNKIVGYEFRKDPTSAWLPSGDKSRFQGLEDAFNKSHKAPLTTPQYYESNGGNQRLVINNNKIVGYEFRKDPTSAWQPSGDKNRFQGLEDAFNKSLKAPTHMPQHPHHNNGSKPSSTQENMDIVSKYYAHAAKSNDDGRSHLFDASSEHFHGLKGDYLKTKILCDFKDQLSKCTDLDKFDAKVASLRSSTAYDILATGQGITTKILGRETSSVTAFNNMVKDLRESMTNDDTDQDKIAPVY
ncbi:MAG: hypothetical protein P4L79_05975 [Legionella sp.]|uniref:hypothetical protein n=1 Tax=Legionella sp. TaxID=459 RepID=UPI00284D0E35|nr:hypothetical protein [Legionella sp.]